MENKEYDSNSDESDEEYCPDDKCNEQLSEEDSDGEEFENLENNSEDEKTTTKKKQNRKRTKKQSLNRNKTKQLKADKIESSESEKEEEKRVYNEEEEKKRADSLWADFLGESKPANETVTSNVKKTNETDKKSTVTDKKSTVSKQSALTDENKTVTITEIFEFAGEEVKVTKEVKCNSINGKDNILNSSSENKNSPSPSISRSLTTKSGFPLKPKSSGLGSILGQLSKNKKISTLEKTKLDWDSFKKVQGIEEEIQTHNKGKDGYLERQDFLQRTDLKQFDIEKGLRQAKRSNR